MWSSICGYFNEVKRNEPARERLRRQFIDAQISGNKMIMKEVRKEWRELDEKENFYLY